MQSDGQELRSSQTRGLRSSSVTHRQCQLGRVLFRPEAWLSHLDSADEHASPTGRRETPGSAIARHPRGVCHTHIPSCEGYSLLQPGPSLGPGSALQPFVPHSGGLRHPLGPHLPHPRDLRAAPPSSLAVGPSGKISFPTQLWVIHAWIIVYLAFFFFLNKVTF